MSKAELLERAKTYQSWGHFIYLSDNGEFKAWIDGVIGIQLTQRGSRATARTRKAVRGD